MQIPWLSYADSMSRSHFKVMGLILRFRARSIAPEPFERFSSNFSQIILSVRRCAEPKTQLCRLKVKVTFQVHGICLSISCLHQISWANLKDFHKTLVKSFISVRRCAEPSTQLRRLKVNVTVHDHGLNPSFSCPLHIFWTLWKIFATLLYVH